VILHVVYPYQYGCFTVSLIVIYTQTINSSPDTRLSLDFDKNPYHRYTINRQAETRCHILSLVASYRKILQIHAAAKKKSVL
jgi:hypothetical protein